MVKEIDYGIINNKDGFDLVVPNKHVYVCSCGNIGTFKKRKDRRNFRCPNCYKKLINEFRINSRKELTIYELKELLGVEREVIDRFVVNKSSIELNGDVLKITYPYVSIKFKEDNGIEIPYIKIDKKFKKVSLDELPKETFRTLNKGVLRCYPKLLFYKFINSVVFPKLPQGINTNVLSDYTLNYHIHGIIYSKILKLIESPCVNVVLENELTVFCYDFDFDLINTNATDLEGVLGVDEQTAFKAILLMKRNKTGEANELIKNAIK